MRSAGTMLKLLVAAAAISSLAAEGHQGDARKLLTKRTARVKGLSHLDLQQRVMAPRDLKDEPPMMGQSGQHANAPPQQKGGQAPPPPQQKPKEIEHDDEDEDRPPQQKGSGPKPELERSSSQQQQASPKGQQPPPPMQMQNGDKDKKIEKIEHDDEEEDRPPQQKGSGPKPELERSSAQQQQASPKGQQPPPPMQMQKGDKDKKIEHEHDEHEHDEHEHDKQMITSANGEEHSQPPLPQGANLRTQGGNGGKGPSESKQPPRLPEDRQKQAGSPPMQAFGPKKGGKESEEADAPCYSIARQANLTAVLGSPNLANCKVASVVLLPSDKGGPAAYDWYSSAELDSTIFHLILMAHDESPKRRPLVNLHGDTHIRAGPMNAKSVRFNGKGMTNAAPFVTLRGNMLFDNVEFDGFASPVLSVVAENGARVSKCSFRAPALQARRLADAEAAKSFALVNVEKGTFVAQRAEFTNERGPAVVSHNAYNWLELSKSKFNRNKDSALVLHGSRAGCDECSFQDNKAQSGGAVKVLNGGGFGCRRCRFLTNGASEHGGAIFADASLLMLRDSLFQGGAAAQGGAIYAQGDSFVYAQGLRLNANAAPAIQTVNNVTMLLNTTCFTDNGDATTSGKARNVVQRDAVADTTATLSHYCSAYSKADTDKSQDFSPAANSPTLTVSASETCAETCSPTKSDDDDAMKLPEGKPLSGGSGLSTDAVPDRPLSSKDLLYSGYTLGGPTSAAGPGYFPEEDQESEHKGKLKTALRQYAKFRAFVGQPIYRTPTAVVDPAAPAAPAASAPLPVVEDKQTLPGNGTSMSSNATSMAGNETSMAGVEASAPLPSDPCPTGSLRLVLVIDTLAVRDTRCFDADTASARPYLLATIGNDSRSTYPLETVTDSTPIDLAMDSSAMLPLGCHTPDEILVLTVKNADNDVVCSQWKVSEWTSMIVDGGYKVTIASPAAPTPEGGIANSEALKDEDVPSVDDIVFTQIPSGETKSLIQTEADALVMAEKPQAPAPIGAPLPPDAPTTPVEENKDAASIAKVEESLTKVEQALNQEAPPTPVERPTAPLAPIAPITTEPVGTPAQPAKEVVAEAPVVTGEAATVIQQVTEAAKPTAPGETPIAPVQTPVETLVEPPTGETAKPVQNPAEVPVPGEAPAPAEAPKPAEAPAEVPAEAAKPAAAPAPEGGRRYLARRAQEGPAPEGSLYLLEVPLDGVGITMVAETSPPAAAAEASALIQASQDAALAEAQATAQAPPSTAVDPILAVDPVQEVTIKLPTDSTTLPGLPVPPASGSSGSPSKTSPGYTNAPPPEDVEGVNSSASDREPGKAHIIAPVVLLLLVALCVGAGAYRFCVRRPATHMQRLAASGAPYNHHHNHPTPDSPHVAQTGLRGTAV